MTIREIARLTTMLAGLIAPRLRLGFASATSRLRLTYASTTPWLRSPVNIVARHATTLIVRLGTKYTIVWLEGLQLLPSVKDIILDNEDSEDNFQFATLDYIPDFFNLLNYLF